MKHHPTYEGVGSEEIEVRVVTGRRVGIITTVALGDYTTIWLTPEEARALGEDLIATADEAES